MPQLSSIAPQPASPVRRAVVICAALLAVSLVVGCGDTDTDPQDEAESTVKTLLDACAHGSAEAALAVLTPPERSTLIMAESVAAGCERVLRLEIEDQVLAPEIFAHTVVESVSADAGFGTATIRAPDGTTSELELESTGDRWLIANPASS